MRRISALLRAEGRSVPTLTAAMGNLHAAPFDHRTGFLLSLLDGTTNLETLLDICAMPAQEAVALLTELGERGLVRWLRPATRKTDVGSDTPRPSPKSIESLTEETLEAIFDALKEMTDSPRARELRAKARSYEPIVMGWATAPPSPAQRDATFDLVVELHTELAELKRRPRSSRRGVPEPE